MYTILTEFISFDENMETIDYEQSREVSLQALRRVNNIFALIFCHMIHSFLNFLSTLIEFI